MNSYLIYFLILLDLLLILLVLFRTSQLKEIGHQAERNWKKLEDIQNRFALLEQGTVAMKEQASENRDLVLNSICRESAAVSGIVSKEQLAIVDAIAKEQQAILSIENQRMEALDRRMEGLEKRLSEINRTTENRLLKLQESNETKLNEMRETVDEKLQKTLESRLTQSFQQVSEQLEQVYKGLGEMQNLATGVGDLRRMLTNVKTRGILGEIQLGAILEQILPRERYDENVATVPGSDNRVEFAIRLPGEDEKHPVYLPIDSKFPLDTYEALRSAAEAGNPEETVRARKALEQRIRSEAKDIHGKYVAPPHTTDFAILFLPVEGLYAEAVQDGLVEVLQREYKVNIAGPSTMAAMLNALQMGFKTLAIQKHTNEVWNVLNGVQKEFETFGSVLEKTQSRLHQADDELEKLIGVRTRMIQSRLKKVTKLEGTVLPRETIEALLDSAEPEEEEKTETERNGY